MEPLSALFMMIVSWMISFFRACLFCMLGCLWVSVAFVMFCILPLCLPLSLGVCDSGGIVVSVCGLFLRVAGLFCVEFCVYLFGVYRGWA